MFSSVGMECGNRESPSLTHFLEFVLPYVKRINSLEYREVIKVDKPSLKLLRAKRRVAGGVYGFLEGTRLKLFAPGSFLRRNEWEIVAPVSSHNYCFRGYCFCPSANVAAFAEILWV